MIDGVVAIFMMQPALPENMLGDEKNMKSRFRVSGDSGDLCRAKGEVLMHNAVAAAQMLQPRVECDRSVTRASPNGRGVPVRLVSD